MTSGSTQFKVNVSTPPVGDCLVSWKEIAAYFKREVRTLQRWEKTEGLPVHRHYHCKLATVYAYASELDQWRASRALHLDPFSKNVIGAGSHTIPALKRSRSQGTANSLTEAHVLYLKGRYCWSWRTTERLNKAIDYFEQAIEQDPEYALAYAGLADTYNSLWFFGGASHQEGLSRAKEEALKAIAIDENLAEAHAALGCVMTFNWEWSGAEKQFQKSIQLNPGYGPAHHWYADFLAALGRHDEALTEIHRARDVDPLSLNINSDVGGILYLARRYDQAMDQCRKTLEIDPDHWMTHWILGAACWQRNRLREATIELQTALSLSERNAIVLASLAKCYLAGDRRREARKLIDELESLTKEKKISSYQMAVVHAMSKETDEALRCLKRAYKEKASWMVLLKVDPQLDNLRSDPRFHELLGRVGLG